MEAKSHQVARATFEASRAAEYFDVANLATMTGQPEHRLVDVILKELSDNGLDAGESTKEGPSIRMGIRRRGKYYQLVVSSFFFLSSDGVGRLIRTLTRASIGASRARMSVCRAFCCSVKAWPRRLASTSSMARARLRSVASYPCWFLPSRAETAARKGFCPPPPMARWKPAARASRLTS